MWQFNQSLAYDKRMYAEDIRGSIAYAKALEKRDIFTSDECIAVVKGLEAVGKEWEDGTVRHSFLLEHNTFERKKRLPAHSSKFSLRTKISTLRMNDA